MKHKPTDMQQKVLDVKDKSVIVSASAGSGKTTIMIEKVLRLISEDRVKVKDILVITFTNASASEMKQKLINELESAIEKTEDFETKSFLQSQSEDVESANICTIDKFCGNLVKKYFYEPKINPNYTILVEDQALIMKEKVFQNVLLKELKANRDLFDLCDMLSKKRTSSQFKEIVYSACNFLLVQSDREKFIKDVALSCYNTDLSSNACYKFIDDFVYSTLNSIYEKLAKIIEQLNYEKDDRLNEYANNLLTLINQTLSKDDKAKKFLLSLNSEIKIPDSMRFSKGLSDNQANLKSQLNNLKNEFKYSVSKLQDLVCGSYEEIREKLSSTKRMIEMLIDFVQKFLNEFMEEKKTINCFEFNDIEHFALDILKNEVIRQAVLKDITCVFVDEFQDVNELQYKIISQLSKENNLFLVGDVKQSIYGFRLCDPTIFLAIYNDYKLENKHKEALNLTENFRSDKRVLDFVNQVFCSCMTIKNCGFEYSDGSKLIGKNEFKRDDGIKSVTVTAIVSPVKERDEGEEEEVSGLLDVYSVKNHENEEDKQAAAKLQAQVICDKVGLYLQSSIFEEDNMRAVKYSDIAILFRSRSSVYYNTKKMLEDSGVKVICEAKEDLGETLEISFINSALKLTNNAFDDISLLTVLTFFTDLSMDDIAIVRSAFSNEERFYTSVYNYAEQKQDAISSKINKVLNKINKLRLMSKYMNVYDLTLNLINMWELENTLIALPDGSERIKNLNLLLGVMSKEEMSLSEYISFNEVSKDRKFKSSSSSEDGVILTTIHASKGLEYPIVILADAGNTLCDNKGDKNESIIYNNIFGVCAPNYDADKRVKSDTIALTAAKLFKKQNELSEEMRMLYVALTRAKNHISVVGFVSKKMLENTEFNLFNSQSYLSFILNSLSGNELEMLKSNKVLNKNDYSYEIINTDEIELDEKGAVTTTIFGKSDTSLVKELNKYIDFSYAYSEANEIAKKNTVTALNKDKQDKKIRYKINHYEFCEGEEVNSVDLGTLYHKVLEVADFSLINNLTDIKEIIEKVGTKGALNEDTLFSVITQLKMLCKNAKVYKEKQFLLLIPYNEVFENSSVSDEILIQGVVDLIIETDNGIIIVDYKATKERDKEVLISRYKTQLLLYKQAVERSFNKKVISLKIFSIFGGILIDID